MYILGSPISLGPAAHAVADQGSVEVRPHLYLGRLSNKFTVPSEIY